MSESSIPESVRSGSRHALYRFFDAGGKLLYIGITCNPSRRFAQHGAKEWWATVTRIEITEHPDRASVIAAEQAAIRSEAPTFNIRGTGNGWKKRQDADEAIEEAEIDGLIGRWFHSTRDLKEGEQREDFQNYIDGKPVVWQGRVIDYDNRAQAFVVELFSWLDGEANGQRLVTASQMSGWRFYVSSLEMNCAFGCPDSTRTRIKCGGPIEYFIAGVVKTVACGRCAHAWAGPHYEVLYREGHPVIGKQVTLRGEVAL